MFFCGATLFYGSKHRTRPLSQTIPDAAQHSVIAAVKARSIFRSGIAEIWRRVMLAGTIHTSALSAKPSDGPSCGRTIGFIAEIGHDFGKGPSAILTLGIWPCLPRRVRLSHLPLVG
jgi:hypothetical protein